MSLQMLHDYILIELDDAKEETSGGIILTSAAIDKPCTGTVISAGPGKFAPNGERLEHGIQVGDSVIFPAAALNREIKHEGKTFNVLNAEQIFGVDR